MWFFANKGEDWRLSAAYIEQGHPRAGTIGALDYASIFIVLNNLLFCERSNPNLGSCRALERLD